MLLFDVVVLNLIKSYPFDLVSSTGKSYSQDAGARLVLQGSECYDKATDKWTVIGQMRQPHWRLVTCVL